jgi:hypothetical protein
MTCVRVPAEVMAAFAPRRRVPVVVTIEEQSWRSTIALYGDDCVVPVRAEIRAAIGADTGDVVMVTMQRDDRVRDVTVPDDLARALEAGAARESFDAMSFSHRNEYVRWITDAKRAETRVRRIDATVRNALEKRPLK